jgi:hypothetical protein
MLGLVPVQVLGLEPVLVLAPVRSPSSVDDVFIVPLEAWLYKWHAGADALGRETANTS